MEGEPITEEDAFRDKWQAKGLSKEQIDIKWQEFWQLEGYRDKLERQGLSVEQVTQMVREKELEWMRKRA